MLSQVPIARNEEKTLHPYPLTVKGIKTRQRKLVRDETSWSIADYDSRRDESDEEGEGDDEDEKAVTE